MHIVKRCYTNKFDLASLIVIIQFEDDVTKKKKFLALFISQNLQKPSWKPHDPKVAKKKPDSMHYIYLLL